jgi:Family of unknown function (DUF6062)
VSSDREAALFEVREALAQPGCPLCRLALRTVARYLTSISEEHVNDVALRAQLRATGGFCSTHAYQWLRESHNVLGTALIFRDLLVTATQQLEDARRSARPGLLGAWRGRPAPPPGPTTRACLACRQQADAEKRYLDALLIILRENPAAADSEGLCLPHARATVTRGGPASDRAVAATRAAVDRLLAVLDEVIRKEDYRFRHEPKTEAERAANREAVARVVGADGLTRP